MPGKYSLSRLIAAPPAIVQTISADAFNFLNTLPVPDFSNTADVKALWAAAANDQFEGSVFPSTGGTASTWIVSAETYKRLKAFRF